MPHHHVIPLRDLNDRIVNLPPALDQQGKPQEAQGNPYSPTKTCSRCHEHDIIRTGWHFNAAQDKVTFDRVHFKSLGDFALVYECVYQVEAPEYPLYMDIQQAINLDIYRRFAEEGIEFAYPTQTLIVEQVG